MQEILQGISKFNPIFSKEMNVALCEEVTEEETHSTLFSM